MKTLLLSATFITLGLLVVGCRQLPAERGVDDGAFSWSSSSFSDSSDVGVWRKFSHDESGLVLRYPPDWELIEMDSLVQILSPDRKSDAADGASESSLPLISIQFDKSVPSTDHKMLDVTIGWKKALDSGWVILKEGGYMAGGDRERVVQIINPPIVISAYAGYPKNDPGQKNEKILNEILATVNFEVLGR